MTPSARIGGILLVVLAAGCAGAGETPPGVKAQQTGPLEVDPRLVGPGQDWAVAAEPRRPEAREEATVALAPPPPVLVPPPPGSRPPVIAGIEAIGIEPEAGAPPPPVPPSRIQGTAKAAAPPVGAPARVSAARNVEPPLDVAALKARLRDTSAIGVFTKLALKNQMDDLLKRFRAHHQSGQRTGIASLRQPYDVLVLKVVSVVHGGDPSLARTIAESREAIWDILADPEKFNAAT